MRVVRLMACILAVMLLQTGDASLISGLIRGLRSLSKETEMSTKTVAYPVIHGGSMVYKNSRDILDTLGSLPIISDVTAGFQNVFNVGRMLAAPGVNMALGALEKTCKPLKALIGDALEDDMDTDVEELKISLVTPTGQDIFTIADAPKAIMSSYHFDPNLKTVMYIHGYTDDPSMWSFSEISTAFQKSGSHNILALDSSTLLRLFYLKASSSVKYIGERLAIMLLNLVDDGVPPEDILLVGHSLGAYIAGHAGRTFYKIAGIKLSRISSLDPAGPCFVGSVEPDLRLSKTDAEFVDVIHTNMGVAGLNEAFGHVDFIVNGGTVQPGCFEPACDHTRAVEFYAESVLDGDAFLAVECEDWFSFITGKCKTGHVARMGYAADNRTRGMYFLKTSGKKPFGMGWNGI